MARAAQGAPRGLRVWSDRTRPRAPPPADRVSTGRSPSRLERFASVDSTQADRALPGSPPAAPRWWSRSPTSRPPGRGRLDRSWTAPSGAALLCSIGFRPVALPASHAWRLARPSRWRCSTPPRTWPGCATARLALKWPNDLVAVMDDGQLRKVAGVLGESVLGTDGSVASAVVGIGVNADWAAADFPPALADSMSSLRELAGGRPIDREALLDGFLARLEPRYQALMR